MELAARSGLPALLATYGIWPVLLVSVPFMAFLCYLVYRSDKKAGDDWFKDDEK